jgi:DNA-binding CsgD family transcriptional regulator
MTTLHTPSLFRGEMQLTPCEFQVCYELVNTALVHKQIAAKLGKSAKTVEVQIASAYKKLGVTSRWELIQRFNSEREIQVKSLPSKGFVSRIMQRLDEIERVLNDLLTDERRSPSPVRIIESVTSVDASYSPRYSSRNVNGADSVAVETRICSALHRASAARRTGTD